MTAGPAGYLVSDDPARLDVGRVHRWLSTQAYWARGRAEHVQRAAIAGSRVYGVYREDPGGPGEQVAFGRVVTDGATFAWLCDVFVDPDERGRGIAHWLVGIVLDHLELDGVRRVLLATRDAHGLYADLGFTTLADPATWMERDRRLSVGPSPVHRTS